MPEGIEVAHLRDWLSRKIKGTKLQGISILSGRYHTKQGRLASPPKGYISFFEALPLRVQGVHNRGKFIWVELEDDWTIWITLGMTGGFSNCKGPYSRSKWDFSQKDSKFSIYFNDMRNFGTLRFIHDIRLLQDKLGQLGFDPIRDGTNFTFDAFHRSWKKEKQTQKIGMLFLKQSFIAGIGNYLRAEVLYQAGVDPHCQLRDIPLEFQKRIWKAIKDLFRDGYNREAYQYKFKVYKQKTDPQGNKVIGEKFYNRTMWWSPNAVQLRCKEII